MTIQKIMKQNRRYLPWICSLSAVMIMGMPVMAESTPGVTVEADENSPTGYTATFVYENAEASEVKLLGTFSFYTRGYPIGAVPETFYGPEEWETGMFRAGFGDIGPWEGIMEKEEDTDYWTISIPLPSGHYEYFYNVDGAEENIEDPANPAMVADTENGGTTHTSVFDVPYDEEKQKGSIDWSFMIPQEGTEKGEVSFVNYEDVKGDVQSLGIYLPAGYDAEAEEPYKVLYLSHGGGGNEVEWFDHGSVNVIFDNLIANGEVEPTIVVTMNNNIYRLEERQSDYEAINGNLMEHIIPYMEENYNVSTEAEGRGYGGISMGARITKNLYAAHADQFGYFCFVISDDPDVDVASLDQEKLANAKVVYGDGLYEYNFPNITTTVAKMQALGLQCKLYLVDGGHDYASSTPQILHLFAKNDLWK